MTDTNINDYGFDIDFPPFLDTWIPSPDNEIVITLESDDTVEYTGFELELDLGMYSAKRLHEKELTSTLAGLSFPGLEELSLSSLQNRGNNS